MAERDETPIPSAKTPIPNMGETPLPLSRPPYGSVHELSHPRGRIRPPLGQEAPRWRRIARALFRLAQGLYYHDVFQVAPAMAFHFFLSLLPLLAFVGYVLGLVAEQKGVSTVLALFLSNLPTSTEAVVKAEVIALGSADRLGPISLAGFFWIASGGIHGLMDALERVVGARPRPWWRKRVIALGWVVATLVAFSIASYGTIEWDHVTHIDPESGRTIAVPTLGLLRSGGTTRVIGALASLVVAVGGLSAFYRFSVAHSRTIKRRVLPGAIVAVGLWVAVSWGFGVYVQSLTNYTVYYGSLAVVAVLLVWLWLVSIAMLIGAELNSQLEGIRDALLSDPA